MRGEAIEEGRKPKRAKDDSERMRPPHVLNSVDVGAIAVGVDAKLLKLAELVGRAIEERERRMRIFAAPLDQLGICVVWGRRALVSREVIEAFIRIPC